MQGLRGIKWTSFQAYPILVKYLFRRVEIGSSQASYLHKKRSRHDHGWFQHELGRNDGSEQQTHLFKGSLKVGYMLASARTTVVLDSVFDM